MVKLNVDVSRRIAPQAVCAKQGDTTRRVKLAFFENGQEWAAPTGMSAMVAFGKPDATGGVYDTLPDGSSAITVASDRKSAIITLAPQVTSVAGICTAELRFYNSASGAQFGLFSFLVDVEAASDSDLQSANYFYLSVIGDMSALKTSAKSTIVAAINSVIDALSSSSVTINRAIEALQNWKVPIPDSAATIGDYVAVASVDENGKPASWEYVKAGGITITASDVTYSGNIGDYQPENVAAAIEALINTMDDQTVTASDVSYSGSIGGYEPKNVNAAIEALLNYTDDKVGSIPVTTNADDDYAASGAQTVQAWATMAGSTTGEYRVKPGSYRIEDNLIEITSVASVSQARLVKVTSFDDEFYYVEVWFAVSPGATPFRAMYLSTEELLLELNGINCLMPVVNTRDNGSFLRVVNGAWKAAQLTDVSEVGA